jgi:ribonuclease E
LGTGLVEAFSTTCTHCAGRGIVLHGDPVDTASSSNAGRKSETTGGSRRSKRGKRGNARPEPEEVPVVKVPDHPAGEHPMFKAMAAANGRHDEDDEGHGAHEAFDEHEQTDGEVHEAEGDEQTTPEQADESTGGEFDTQDADEPDEADEADESEDSEDSDEDDAEDEIDLDDDLDDDDEDDDLDDIDDDSDDEDSDDDSDDEEDDDDSDDEEDEDEPEEDVYQAPAPVIAEVQPSRGRTRRRAAARPAGPPTHE